MYFCICTGRLANISVIILKRDISSFELKKRVAVPTIFNECFSCCKVTNLKFSDSKPKLAHDQMSAVFPPSFSFSLFLVSKGFFFHFLSWFHLINVADNSPSVEHPTIYLLNKLFFNRWKKTASTYNDNSSKKTKPTKRSNRRLGVVIVTFPI